MDGASELAGKLTSVIINPLIALIFAAGLLVFIWGIVEYIWGLSTDTKGKEKGKQHMLWGIIGMFVMAVSYTILKIIAGTLGVSLPR